MDAAHAGSLRTARTAVEITWYLAWGLAVVAVLAPIVFALAPGARTALVTRGVLQPHATQSLPFEVRYGPDSALSLRERPDARGPQLIGHNDVVVARDLTPTLLAGGVFVGLLTAALVLWTLYQLRMLVRTVSRGAPFDPANPGRIRRIGWLVVAYGPVSGLLGLFEVGAWLPEVSAAVRRAFPDASVGYTLNLNLATVVVGLIILAIAEAFDAGVRLQREQDLTV